MRKLLIPLLGIILLTAGIFYYINTQQPVLDQPLIPQEEAEEKIEETVPENEEAEETEREGNSFSERLSLALQETMERLFQREVKIVAIGDSLTRGVGDATEGGGYIGILERTLNQDRQVATFENFGVPGNRTDQLLRRLGQPEIQDSMKKANMILITIGANDIMEVVKENFTNLEIDDFIEERVAYEERLDQILVKLQNVNKEAEIYLLGIYNPFEKYFQEIEELNQIVDAWNETGNRLANEKENITFIPIDDLFSDNDELLLAEDNFHPNYSGYYLMAKRVLDYISKNEG